MWGKTNFNVNFNRSTLTLTLRRKKIEIKCCGKKTTPNDGPGFSWKKKRHSKLNNESGICPNLTFEDYEFKEDNKALNDQGDGERELMLFCLP